MGATRRLNAMAIAREDDAAKGTAVAASTGHFFAVSSGQIAPVAEYSKFDGMTETIEAGFEQHLAKIWSEIAFSAPVKSDWIGHFLTGILGSVSSANSGGETTVRDHTITVSESGSMPAYTTFQLDPVQDDRATYSTVKKLEFNCPADGILTADVEMIAQAKSNGSGTSTYSTDHHFQGSHATLKFASATSGLGAASAINFHSLRLTIERDVTPIWQFGNTSPQQFVGGALRISGEVTILWEATTYRDYFTGETDQAMLIDFDDTGTTIGSAENPQLKITLDKINVVDSKRPDGIDEPDIETLTFEASYDLDEATPRMIQVLLVNEESTTAYTEPA